MCQRRRQVHISGPMHAEHKSKPQNAEHQSASRSCDCMPMHRNPAPLRSRPHDPHTTRSRQWVAAPVNHGPGARPHQLLRHSSPNKAGPTSIHRREGTGPHEEVCFSAELCFLQTNQCANVDAKCICQDPCRAEHKSKPRKAAHQSVSIALL